MIFFCTHLCKSADTNIIYYRNIWFVCFCYTQFYAGITYLSINLSKSEIYAFCILFPSISIASSGLLCSENQTHSVSNL